LAKAAQQAEFNNKDLANADMLNTFKGIEKSTLSSFKNMELTNVNEVFNALQRAS
jgi:hypothetical protein